MQHLLRPHPRVCQFNLIYARDLDDQIGTIRNGQHHLVATSDPASKSDLKFFQDKTLRSTNYVCSVDLQAPINLSASVIVENRTLSSLKVAQYEFVAVPNGVIMGFNTWQSLPTITLKGRINIVVLRIPEGPFLHHNSKHLFDTLNGEYGIDETTGIVFVPSLETALTFAFQFVLKVLPSNAATRIKSIDKPELYFVSENIATDTITTANCLITTAPFNRTPLNRVFVIGGSVLYSEALKSPHLFQLNRIYETVFHKILLADSASASNIIRWNCMKSPSAYCLELSKTSFCSEFNYMQRNIYQLKRNFEEEEYLRLLESHLEEKQRSSRTGIDCLSSFAPSSGLTFYLTNRTVPLLTTKRIFFRGVLTELLFFLSGNTNTKYLAERGIHIWDQNTSRAFLDARGLSHYVEGDMGPAYGFQFAHAGAAYHGSTFDYTGLGTNQLHSVINSIRTDPFGRRHIINLWNVSQLDQMALVPCLFYYQFYVSTNNNKLSLFALMRSADLFLGVPWNICSCSLLLYIVAHCTGLEAYEVKLQFVDSHMYANHLAAVREQIIRKAVAFPMLEPFQMSPEQMRTSVGMCATNMSATADEAEQLNKFTLDTKDFQLSHYIAHPAIRAEMAV